MPDLAAADPAVAELLAAAREVQHRAHAPYSKYPVGAAIRTPAGNVHVGCNVENASYPEGICAETAAIAAMVAAGESEIATIVTMCDGDQIGTPCGGCRQRIREFASADTVIHAAGPRGIELTFTMDELLPNSFGPGHLGV